MKIAVKMRCSYEVMGDVKIVALGRRALSPVGVGVGVVDARGCFLCSIKHCGKTVLVFL